MIAIKGWPCFRYQMFLNFSFLWISPYVSYDHFSENWKNWAAKACHYPEPKKCYGCKKGNNVNIFTILLVQLKN